MAAATALFAERGFHGTTVRDIAERAGANVAAGNYHYGSKKALYLEVLRAQFALVRGMLVARGASPKPEELARLARPALVRILRARVKVMLDILIGPPPGGDPEPQIGTARPCCSTMWSPKSGVGSVTAAGSAAAAAVA